jgi:hypothetical protein
MGTDQGFDDVKASQARGFLRLARPDSFSQPELFSGQYRILGYLDAEDK